jgi:cell division protein FtsB
MFMAGLPPLPPKYKAVVFVGAGLLVLVAISAVEGGRGWFDLRRLEEKQRELETLAFRLAQENQQLREHLRRLNEDDAYVEKLARERLGWIKPGEVVFRVRGMISSARAEEDVGAADAHRLEQPRSLEPTDESRFP